MPPVLINWNRHKWGLHSVVNEVMLLYFSYQNYQKPISIHHMVSSIWWRWYNLPWVFGSVFSLYHHIFPDLHGMGASYRHSRMHEVCFVTKASHSLYMEKAESWNHHGLERLKTMLGKGNGEDTKYLLTGDPTDETLPPVDYTGRVCPSNSHCVV